MHTERVTYLTSAEQKAALEAFAKARGESVGNVIREAVVEYMGQPTKDEEAELATLVEQVNEAIPRMHASLDRMQATLRSTHDEMQAFFREKGIA
jgi:hypothetical protein